MLGTDASPPRDRALAAWRRWLDRLSQPRARLAASVARVCTRVAVQGTRAHKVLRTLRQTHFSLPLVYSVLPDLSLRRRESAPSPNPYAPGSVRATVRVIANPASGTMVRPGGQNDLVETVRWLNEHGMPAELCLTERAGHAEQLAREAVEAGMDMVVAAGGDGTVNDVVQALAGHTTALGVLPLGTVNVWAREVGIPLATAEARELLLRGVRRRVDLGRAGKRYFLLMAGIGFDAEVARRVEQSVLKRVGLKLLEYIATVGRLGMTHPSTRVWLRTTGKRRSTRALMIIIGNTRLYGGALQFTTRAVADDGLLDVVIVGGGGLLHRLGVVARALLRRPSLGPRVRYERCRTLRLESEVPLPVQVDGEVLGTLPMTFSVAPLALTVVVPRNAPAHLFGRQPEHRRSAARPRR